MIWAGYQYHRIDLDSDSQSYDDRLAEDIAAGKRLGNVLERTVPRLRRLADVLRWGLEYRPVKRRPPIGIVQNVARSLGEVYVGFIGQPFGSGRSASHKGTASLGGSSGGRSKCWTSDAPRRTSLQPSSMLGRICAAHANSANWRSHIRAWQEFRAKAAEYLPPIVAVIPGNGFI